MPAEGTSTLYRVKRRGLRYGRSALDRAGSWLAERSPCGDRPVFDVAQFAWVKPLEAAFASMRSELDRLLEHRDRIPNFQDISPDQAHLARGDLWKTYFLYAYGYRSDEGCARCPETARAVSKVPGMKTAFFSILAPHTHVPAHRGPYKGLLRYHLGLRVPRPERCRLRVASELLSWREGQSLLFDDTYEHEVWNDSDQDRVVLFLDVLRPLPERLGQVNAMFVKAVGFSPLVQDGLRNLARWQKADASSHAQVF